MVSTKVVMWGVALGGLAVAGFVAYKFVLSDSAKKAVTDVKTRTQQILGMDFGELPFLSKKEAADSHAELAASSPAAPPHSAPILPPQSSIGGMAGRGAYSPATTGRPAPQAPRVTAAPVQTRAISRSPAHGTYISRPAADAPGRSTSRVASGAKSAGARYATTVRQRAGSRARREMY